MSAFNALRKPLSGDSWLTSPLRSLTGSERKGLIETVIEIRVGEGCWPLAISAI